VPAAGKEACVYVVNPLLFYFVLVGGKNRTRINGIPVPQHLAAG
jgi:hypothetical protein